jgi:hypothetical protein
MGRTGLELDVDGLPIPEPPAFGNFEPSSWFRLLSMIRKSGYRFSDKIMLKQEDRAR